MRGWPRRLGVAFLTLSLLACAGLGKDDDDDDDDDDDEDNDGLSADEEDDLGTDPDEADSDGDGWEDGDEVDGNTDPLDPADMPYTAGWPKDACRWDVASTGNSPGDIAEDFELLDQYGEVVRLHDFCDHYVYLIFAAFW